MPSPQSPAKPVFQADPENIAHIAQVAADQVEAAIGIVAPADGHLLDAVAEAARDGENFHVEHVAVDLLAAEQFLRNRVLKELEAALRIVDAGQADEGLHEIVESPGATTAVEGLGLFDGGAFVARADDGIDAGFQERAKFIELADG